MSAPLKNKRTLLLLALIVSVAGGVYLWRRERTPEPPAIDLSDADPEIVRAVEKARDAVRATPRSGAAWGHLGMVLAVHSFDAEARDCFEQAERFDPADPRWPYFRGTMLRREAPDEAIPLLERAVQRAGSQAAMRLRLAETLFEQNRLDEAEAQFRMVPESDPHHARACVGQARIALARDDPRAAVVLLIQASETAPQESPVAVLLAEAYHRMGDEGAARKALPDGRQPSEEFEWPDPYIEQMAELRVGLKARIATARQLLARKRVGEALDLMEKTVEAYPDSYDAWLELGKLRLQAGERRDAEQALRQALRLRDNTFEVHFFLAATLNPRAAAEEFRRALAINPGHAEAHYNLAHCLEALNNREMAVEELREALRYKPDLAAARYELAAWLADLGRDAEALPHLEYFEKRGTLDEKSKELLKQVRTRVGAGPKR
jgi:tetratricopeptide (TPR) repeat protein